MATQTVSFTSNVYIPLSACQEVYLCLAEGWDAFTVSGTRFLLATVENVGRSLGGYTHPMYGVDPRGNDVYEYSFTYDDAQITLPLVNIVECEDIMEVFPYPCTLGQLLGLIPVIL